MRDRHTNAGRDEGVERSTVLVVDDEENIRDLLSQTLRLVGFHAVAAAGGYEALAAADRVDPALVVLDVMLPDLDGYEVARRLRAGGRDVPVLFLTAKDTVADRVAGLTVGGDDYVSKPFSLEELVLRIRAILRRTSPRPPAPAPGPPVRGAVLHLADLEWDEDAHEVRRGGRLVPLSPTEFKLLGFLMENHGRVVSKAQILDRVWSYDFGGDGRIVESYIYYLRKKIDAQGVPLIHTVRGVGYTLRPPRGRDGGG